MKKKFLYIGAFILIAATFSSCEDLLTNCKICALNTYEDGVLISSVQEAEYCDAELIVIQATPDTTIGNTVAKWECD